MQDQKRHKMTNKCLIALGANLISGNILPRETLEKSLELYSTESLQIEDQSGWYSTPAFPVGSGPDFVNAAVSVKTELSPQKVLDALHRIENKLGRTRENRWEPRICDLDLIAYDDIVAPNISTFRKWQRLLPNDQIKSTPSELILPHPRMQDRAFVLVPLNDIAPDWHHPVVGLTVNEMLNALPQSDRAEIKPIST